MRNLIIYLALLLCTFASKMYSQESFEARAKSIANTIEKITKEEKENLKKEVEAVNVELDKGIITKQQSDDKKLQLATKSATKIENRIATEEEKLSKLVREKVEGKLVGNDTLKNHKSRFKIILENGEFTNDTITKKAKSEKRTTSQLVFATGVNNVVTNGKGVANSDFRYLGSHFYEFGLTLNTRLSNTTNVPHLKYGLSVMYNNLRATDNRLFVLNGNKTELQTSGISLSDSRFRNIYLVLPLHYELDFSKTKIVDGKPIFDSHEGFRVGFGGFAGMNVSSKQYLEFKDPAGYDVEQEIKGDFNTSNFVYGLSAYIGHGKTSLYLKYDLNPLFRNNDVKQNNISLGIRFDLN